MNQVTIIINPTRSEAEEEEENKSETEHTLTQRVNTDKMRKSLHKVRQAILQTGIVGSGKSMDQDTARTVDDFLMVCESFIEL